MNGLGRLAAAGLLATVATQAEAKTPAMDNAGATVPLVAERCRIDVSYPKLETLAAGFNWELSSALQVTNEEMLGLQRTTALEFAKTVAELDFAGIEREITKVGKEVVLEDEQSIAESFERLKRLKAEIAEISKVMDPHSVRNGAELYDTVGFVASEEDVISRDVPEIFTKYGKKGINCPPEVEAYVVKHGAFPSAGDVDTTLMTGADTQAETLLPEAVDLSAANGSNELKTQKALFLAELSSVRRNFAIEQFRAERLLKDIRTRYSSSK